MTSKKILKAVTLSSFILLIGGFIAFKSGKFDRFMKTGKHKEVQNSESTDSFVTHIDSLAVKTPDSSGNNRIMFSSSKSIVVIDQEQENKKTRDALNAAYKHGTFTDTVAKHPKMMSTSKSMIIIDQEQHKRFDIPKK